MIDFINNILLPLFACWVIIVLMLFLSFIVFDFGRDIFEKINKPE